MKNEKKKIDNGYISGRWAAEFHYKETGEIKQNPFPVDTPQWKGFMDAVTEIIRGNKNAS